MTDITYTEISAKVDELQNLLHEEGYAFASGYMTSLLSVVIASYVPMASRQSVLDHLDRGIASRIEARREVA
jgi:hypothetical protein